METHVLRTYTMALLAMMTLCGHIPTSLKREKGADSPSAVDYVQQNDSSTAVLTVFFTKGFKSDTISVDIDDVSLIHDHVINTEWSTELADAISIHSRAGFLVVNNRSDTGATTLGRARAELVVRLSHKRRSYSFPVDLKKGKYLFISLKDTLHFELSNRQPFFD